MTATPIRTGLIGYGLSGRIFHAPFIDSVEGFELTAVNSRKPEAVLARYPQVRVEAETSALLQDPNLDLMVITAPNALHFPLARDALLAGKNVLLEKPAVTRLQHMEELAMLAQAGNRTLAVYQNRRFDGDFLRLQQLLQKSQLGKLKHLESRYDRFRPHPKQRWREQAGEGSGIFWDLGPHLIDQALALFGPPDSLAARLRILRDESETVDWFELQLHYREFEVTLGSTPYEAGRMRRFNARFDQGGWQCWGLDPQEDALRADQMPWDAAYPDRGTRQQAEYVNADSQGNLRRQPETLSSGHYRDYYQALHRAIHGDASSPVSLADACALIYTLELAEQSSSLGRTLPWQYQPPL